MDEFFCHSCNKYFPIDQFHNIDSSFQSCDTPINDAFYWEYKYRILKNSIKMNKLIDQFKTPD
jgi:hypothetical protein